MDGMISAQASRTGPDCLDTNKSGDKKKEKKKKRKR